MAEKTRLRIGWSLILFFTFLLTLAALHEGRWAYAGTPRRVAGLLDDSVSADTNVFGSYFRPTSTIPSTAYRITVQIKTGGTATKLMWVTKATAGAVVDTGPLFGGETLVPGQSYTCVRGAQYQSTAGEGVEYNIQFDDATNVAELIVDEIQDGAL